MTARGWGYWTEAKLDILSAYLPAFAAASTRAGTVVYLDLFAGNDQITSAIQASTFRCGVRAHSRGLAGSFGGVAPGGVRGPLVPQDPANEPVVVLLERIRQYRATESPKPCCTPRVRSAP